MRHRIAVWQETESESIIGHAFDEDGRMVMRIRSTSENALIHAAEQQLGRPLEFIWIGWLPRSYYEQPWLVFVLLSEQVAA